MKEIVLAETKEGVRLTAMQGSLSRARKAFHLTWHNGVQDIAYPTLEKALNSAPRFVRKELANNLRKGIKPTSLAKSKSKPDEGIKWEHIVLAKTKGFKLTAMYPKTIIKSRPAQPMFYHDFAGMRSEVYPTLTKAMKSVPLFKTKTVVNQIKKSIQNVKKTEQRKVTKVNKGVKLVVMR